MKIVYRVNDSMTCEFEGSSQTEIFKSLADFSEVFSMDTCGKCQKKNVQYTVRTVDDNSYHELRCRSCGARFSFGEHKKGETLFPKRKDANGNWLPNMGWTKWNKETGKNE